MVEDANEIEEIAVEIQEEVPKVEAVKTVRKTRARKKALSPIVVDRFDKNTQDVVQYIKEGRKIYFADGDSFFELPEDLERQLPLEAKNRYQLAKNITLGRNVVETVEDGFRGWAKDYNIRPGSYTDNMAVFGKDPNFKYHWSTPAKLPNHVAKGWEIDRDPNVSTVYKDSCTHKTIGGENKPEQILMRIPKAEYNRQKRKRKERVKRQLKHTGESFIEGAKRLGAEASAV